jgi:lysozyme
MQNSFFKKAKIMLVADEGCREYPYKDSTGHLTIGIGHNLDAGAIGAGAIDALFEQDLKNAIDGARAIWGNDWETFSEHRQLALVNLVFNLGESKFREFYKTIKLIDAGEWAGAAANLLNTKYAKQVGLRAERVALMLEADVFPYENA